MSNTWQATKIITMLQKVRCTGIVLLFLLGVVFIGYPSPALAQTVTIKAMGTDNLPVAGFRWIVEENTLHYVTPGQLDPNPALKGQRFHTSFTPVIATGRTAGLTATVTLPDPAKHYYVSVLPDSASQSDGYALGGNGIAPGQIEVTALVTKMPIPTAQIHVLVFEDNWPIDNVPNFPQERGLEGFAVNVFDAGGRYGMSGGQMTTDVYGNPLGTSYNPDGSVNVMGSGQILTDANGEAKIKYLAPGKYTMFISPPGGEGWSQTSTIEGTKGVDAWVKADEPPYFIEFPPPVWHVFIGFARPTADPAALTGTTTVTGRIVNLRYSRAPDTTLSGGIPYQHTTPWVGVNDMSGGNGKGIYAQRTNADGTFSIPNLPPGTYQIVVWDDNVDLIFHFLGITVNPDGSCSTLTGSCNVGDVPVNNWFTGLHMYTFYDRNEDGFWDTDEQGMFNQVTNLRWRDGTMYASAPTDLAGFVPFDEVFPFFYWLVAEVDYARFKPTGVTVVVDDGGPVDPNDPWSFGGLLKPQPQPENNNLPYRVEQGPVLVQGFQGFIGATNVIQWGKTLWGRNENGGISGIVSYASTRAENDPRDAVQEPWEPGIPRVQMNLYRDNINNGTDPANTRPGPDGKPDKLDANRQPIPGAAVPADVDNWPFQWTDVPGGKPGPEDIDRNGNGVFDLNDAYRITWTDSWDDNLPENCPGDPNDILYLGGLCYDGMRNWNQVRPAVFDGGYAFGSPAGDVIDPGTYIVEAALPPGYEVVKEEDRNVDFGQAYTPSLLALNAPCVGVRPYPVPNEFSLFPLLDDLGGNVPPSRAGEMPPMCNMKQVRVTNGVQNNAAANFNFFTYVPVASHFTGLIADDLGNEINPNSPQFGEKYAPPWTPVALRDYKGREISRIYTDEWGKYDGLLPSTYSANIPTPSGFSPSMYTLCANDPGPVLDTRPGSPTYNQLITDPRYNPNYSQFCTNWQFMPGATTYLDTPTLPIGAFANPGQLPLDCEYADATPKIRSVKGPDTNIPGPYVLPGQTLNILSQGTVQVPNPLWGGAGSANPQFIPRDYGFGNNKGTIKIGTATIPSGQISFWDNLQIVVKVPAGTQTGQLVVTRSSGVSTTEAVTVTVGPRPVRVVKGQGGGQTIQATIDLANPGDLIIVPEGTYREMVIMDRPVQLQGAGPGSTVINGMKMPTDILPPWQTKVAGILANPAYLLPGQQQQLAAGGTTAVFTGDGPGILVLAKNVTTLAQGGFVQNPRARIDGFTFTGANDGGGILVNGYAHYLEISNNFFINNAGIYGGGIRVGHPTLTTADGLAYVDARNDNIAIHNNNIGNNSNLGGGIGAGGGVALYTGSTAYQVTGNYVCGNFANADGAGIGHQGLSNGGLIAGNKILFNQSLNGGTSVHGGGISIAGAISPVLGGLSPGAGNVTVNGNLIQANLANAGDGGGIRATFVNGADVKANKNNPSTWYRLNIFNNMIVNNLAGLAGGGISLQDVARATITHNTIANNDPLAVASEAFPPGNPNQSAPQPAGIVARAHSASLQAAFGTSPAVLPLSEFANPTLSNNIIWHNRAFYYLANPTAKPAVAQLLPDIALGQLPVYSDLGVLGTKLPRLMNPRYSLLTSRLGYSNNNIESTNARFVSEYVNGSTNALLNPGAGSNIETYATPAEGGNYIDVRFGPLTPRGNYHITSQSPARNRGSNSLSTGFTELTRDYDLQTRPRAGVVDMGADEF